MMSSMSSSELTFLGSDMDEDPGPRRWTRRISRFRNEPKIDRHVQHTPTRATRETKRVPRVLNSEDEVSDNSTTPTRHVPNEKSAQSPPRTPMSNSVPKSNQLSGPSTPTPRIKLNLSPIVTRNPKGSISHNLPTHGGTVTTADSGNVTSANGIKLTLPRRSNASHIKHDPDRQVHVKSRSSPPPRTNQQRLVLRVPGTTKPHSIDSRTDTTNRSNIRQPTRANPGANQPKQEIPNHEIRAAASSLVSKRPSRSPSLHEGSDEDPSGMATTILSPELATPSTLTYLNQLSPTAAKLAKGSAQPAHPPISPRTGPGSSYPSPDKATITESTRIIRSPSPESDSSISVISVRQGKGKERASIMPVLPARPVPTVAPMVTKTQERRPATSKEPISAAVGPPRIPSMLATTPSSAASRSSGSTVGPRDLTPWKAPDPIDAVVQTFTAQHLMDRAKMASMKLEGSWNMQPPPPGCARRLFGVRSPAKARILAKVRRSTLEDSPPKGHPSNTEAEALNRRPTVSNQALPESQQTTSNTCTANGPKAEVIVISSSEDEADAPLPVAAMNKNVIFALQLRDQFFDRSQALQGHDENDSGEDESPDTPQLSQTTHERYSSVSSSINQHPLSISEVEVEVIDDSEEERVIEPPISPTNSPLVNPLPKKLPKASSVAPSGKVMDDLRLLPPPLPIFEPFPESTLRFPSMEPVFLDLPSPINKRRNKTQPAAIILTDSSEERSSAPLDYAPIFSFVEPTSRSADTGGTFYASVKEKVKVQPVAKPFPEKIPGPRRVFLGVEIKLTPTNRAWRSPRAGAEDQSEEDELLIGQDEGQQEIQRARERWEMEQARKKARRALKLAKLPDARSIDHDPAGSEGDDDDEYESSADERSKRPTKKRKLDHDGNDFFSRYGGSYQSSETGPSIIGSVKTVDAPYGISVEEIDVAAIELKSLQPPRSGKRATNPDAFCHQCRNSSTRVKPRSVCEHEHPSRDDGEQLRCGKRFCVPCLRKWYGLDDDGLQLIVRESGPTERSSEDQSKLIGPSAMRMGAGFGIVDGKWICPFCAGFCMCTQCVQKRHAPRTAFRPSENGKFEEFANARPRLNASRGAGGGPKPVNVKARKFTLSAPDRWLPTLPAQTEGLDPFFYQSTRPRTRDFPTGAPPPTAAHFAPIVLRNGAVIEDDGLDDSFTGDEMGDNDSPARQHSKVGSASDPTQDPAPSGKSNAVGRARPAQEKRRNYAVVAPGSRLPSTKKAVVPSNAFTNASNQSEPQPPMSSISATSDNPMPDMVPGSPIMCLEPALTFASSDALTFGLNILFDSQESQHGQTLLAATEPGAQPPLQDISLHEAASAGNDVGAEKLLMNVPYPQPEEDATSGPRYNPTSLSTQVAPLSLHPTTSTDSTDGRDPPALAATSGSRSLIPMQLDNIRQMRDLDVFDPMEIEYQMAWEDDATEDFFNTGPSDTLLAMYSPTIDIVGTALGIPPEEADVVSEPSPAVDPFDFGSAFFE